MKTGVCPHMSSAIKEVACIKERCHLWRPQRVARDGAAVIEYDCAYVWTLFLLQEVAQQQMQTGAAMESYRNESVKNAGMVAHAMAAAITHRLEKK